MRLSLINLLLSALLFFCLNTSVLLFRILRRKETNRRITEEIDITIIFTDSGTLHLHASSAEHFPSHIFLNERVRSRFPFISTVTISMPAHHMARHVNILDLHVPRNLYYKILPLCINQ